MPFGLSQLIVEDVAALLAHEKEARDKGRADRLRLRRFVKEGRVSAVGAAAALLGYHEQTIQRWWRTYCIGGLTALLPTAKRRGAHERITPEAWAGLDAEMRAGRIGGLDEAQSYLRERWQVAYGIDAISKLFQRRKTKLKTGRPRHRRAASPAEQAAFEK